MASKDPDQVIQGNIDAIKNIARKYTGKNKAKLLELAKVFIVDQIRIRTRLGKDDSGSKLKELSESYKKQRARYSNNLSGQTTVNRSNLTATGQMLEAIFAKLSGDQIIIDISDKKRQGELTGAVSSLSNKAVAALVETNGRLFFGLTQVELKRFQDELTKDVLRFINSELEKSNAS